MVESEPLFSILKFDCCGFVLAVPDAEADEDLVILNSPCLCGCHSYVHECLKASCRCCPSPCSDFPEY